MSHHVSFTLPDGRRAVANWDDPIVKNMRAARGDSPNSSDLAAIGTWLDNHADQSAACQAAMSLQATCGHEER